MNGHQFPPLADALEEPRLFSEKKPFGKNVEGLSHFRDGRCSFKIVFK
jgi:hypothetical protein